MAYRDDEMYSSPNPQGPTANDAMLRLQGTVEHIIYTNEENGYTVLDFGVEESGEVLTAQGILPYINDGDALILWGNWIHSPKYGRQFKVVQYERHMPADAAAILKYLSSHAVKGVGPKLAARIVGQGIKIRRCLRFAESSRDSH